MKFLLSLGVFLTSMLFSSDLNQTLSINISEVDLTAKTASFPAYDLKIGESGFILTKLSDYEVISAALEITSINNGIALAKISDFNVMKQKYLPTPRVEPKVGDIATFRGLNNRAFLIAPDSNTYERIKSQTKDVSLMSSDLLIGYLNDYGGFDPKPKFLIKACQIYSVGLLYIVGSDSLNILDCQSLTLLEKLPFDTSKIATTSAPFFSRLEEVKSGSLASIFYSKHSKQYFKYYDALVLEGAKFKGKIK